MQLSLRSLSPGNSVAVRISTRCGWGAQWGQPGWAGLSWTERVCAALRGGPGHRCPGFCKTARTARGQAQEMPLSAPVPWFGASGSLWSLLIRAGGCESRVNGTSSDLTCVFMCLCMGCSEECRGESWNSKLEYFVTVAIFFGAFWCFIYIPFIKVNQDFFCVCVNKY